MRQEGDAIFLAGEGASPDGDRPFLDRFDLKTRKSERLFRSDKDRATSRSSRSPAPTDRAFLTWHQSPTDPPNAFLRTLGKPSRAPQPGEAAFASTARAVTHIPDPTPAVRAIKKRLVKYKRKDGVDLSFTLYTPPGLQGGHAHPGDPLRVSARLRERVDGRPGHRLGAGRSRASRNYRLLLLAGYAIIDNAAFPIVGDPKKAYDTYLEQLVDDARGGGRQGRRASASSIATASASPATATAR